MFGDAVNLYKADRAPNATDKTFKSLWEANFSASPINVFPVKYKLSRLV